MKICTGWFPVTHHEEIIHTRGTACPLCTALTRLEESEQETMKLRAKLLVYERINPIQTGKT